MENNETVLNKVSMDVDLVELLTKSTRMNKEFKTFFQGISHKINNLVMESTTSYYAILHNN